MHNPIWLPFHQLSALKEQMMTQPGILGQKSNFYTILFVLRHQKSRKNTFPMCRFEERTSPRGRKHRAGVLLPSASPRERATPALCFLPLEFGPFLEPTHREELFPFISTIETMAFFRPSHRVRTVRSFIAGSTQNNPQYARKLPLLSFLVSWIPLFQILECFLQVATLKATMK